MDYSTLMPKVINKVGNSLLEMKFDITRITNSLERETSMTPDKIETLCVKFLQFALASNIHFLTSPIIREILCVQMMGLGWEKHRLEYTRLGLPFNDIKQIISDPEFSKIIEEHVRFEYRAVQAKIEELSQND